MLVCLIPTKTKKSQQHICWFEIEPGNEQKGFFPPTFVLKGRWSINSVWSMIRDSCYELRALLFFSQLTITFNILWLERRLYGKWEINKAHCFEMINAIVCPLAYTWFSSKGRWYVIERACTVCPFPSFFSRALTFYIHYISQQHFWFDFL